MPGGAIGQASHERGSPLCKGESCKLHGAMIRKMARRAESAAWASRKGVAGERVVDVTVPGTLGMTKPDT
jgi:hypothetical protein